MNLKNSKRTMRNGFMCPSEASTAVWSAVVPRKRHERSVSLDDTRLINCSNYSKIVDSATATFNSAHNSLSSANIQQRSQNQENGSTQLHKTPTDHVFQVVVMRVAIHCEGCAGKVKKHLSKMEDVESKRVTVMGYISPVGVLQSISKVKRAEFWTC
ncbi:protein SODIUM POTASSIUM ROOT DEFECTIVE 3-like isoform X2 [Phaseolus vulgaris]|uniref:protein SODIUM POTASSIUM ROOT DEFECTIVE 3-like isoform X2 n=1 Tax=Phaseolus vulgaris TaxID=3885 RepID=UPI0035CA01FB